MLQFILNHWFLLLMQLIAGILSFIWFYVFNKDKLNMKWWECFITSILLIVFGAISSLFFYSFENGFDINKGYGIRIFGFIFFAPLFILVFSKIKKITISNAFDVLIVAIIFSNIGGKINCLHAGCCIGIRFNDSGPRWPAREIELLIHALFLVFVIPWIKKGNSNGMAYPLYMVIYGIGRFANEWLTLSNATSAIHISHVWAAISVLLGIIWIIIPRLLSKRWKGVMKNETTHS